MKTINNEQRFDLLETDILRVNERMLENRVYTAITSATTLTVNQLIGGILDINCTTASFNITLPSLAELNLKENDSFGLFVKCRTATGCVVDFLPADIQRTSVSITSNSRQVCEYKFITQNTGGTLTLDMYRIVNSTSAFPA